MVALLLADCGVAAAIGDACDYQLGPVIRNTSEFEDWTLVQVPNASLTLRRGMLLRNTLVAAHVRAGLTPPEGL